MAGPGSYYADFRVEKQWEDAPPRQLHLSQLGSDALELKLRKFVPPRDDRALATDFEGRPMYATPWAIVDPDVALNAINKYVDASLGQHPPAMLDDSDRVVWDVFILACRSYIFPSPVSYILICQPLMARTDSCTKNLIMRKAIRMWVVCRLVEGGWRCWPDRLACPQIASDLHGSPDDWDSVPPYLDHQLRSLVTHRILMPVQEELLQELEHLTSKHNPDHWLATFVTSFILLHNYEAQMNFQVKVSKRIQSQVSFSSITAPYLQMSLCINLRHIILAAVSRHATCTMYKLGGRDHSGPFPLLLQRMEALHHVLRLELGKHASYGSFRRRTSHFHEELHGPCC